MPLSKSRSLAIAAVFALAGWACSANADSIPPPPLTANQIVTQMLHHNQARDEQLRHYQSTRHYQVQYKGFSTSIVAAMDVDFQFDAATGKSYRIVSRSGSKFLCDKVLKRAVDSEIEASRDKSSTALSSANYTFQLLGIENLSGRPAFILDVAPIAPSKFLYKGKVWVDAADFAVVKIEASPARNPSVWISRTLIDFKNEKTGDFWLPAQNRSETKVRIGGTAVLTIDYGAYRVVPEATVASSLVTTRR